MGMPLVIQISMSVYEVLMTAVSLPAVPTLREPIPAPAYLGIEEMAECV